MPPKKKKKKKRARGQGAGRGTAAAPVAVEKPDPNERRRERLEARRQEKAKAMAAQRRAEVRNRAIRFVMFVGFALFVVWFFFLRVQLPSSIEGNEIEDFSAFAAESRNNQLHTEEDIAYDSDPPVSGPHSQSSEPCGVHGTQLADEKMVHTLEHAAVGILYQPDLDPEEIKDIEALVKSFDSKVFSGPYADMETPVTLVAWAHLMRLDGYDESAVREFIDVFRNGGVAPEKQQECDNIQDQPFEPGANATETIAPPTPGPTNAPSPKPKKTKGN